MTLLCVGVQSSEDRKENLFFAELSFHRKLFSLKNFWKVCNKKSMGHKNYQSNWNLYFENNFYGKILWWESFFKGHCCQWEYRGPTIEKKLYFGEIIFFTDFCFPQTKLIRLASFINGVHKNDAINKNASLEKLFFKAKVFLQKHFWMT